MRKVLYLMGILNDSDLEWMAEHGVQNEMAERAVLIREGQPVDSLFIVLDGSLAVSTRGRNVALLQTGEVVGEISFVDSQPPAATVTVAQHARILAIRRDELRNKLESDPWFASRFYRALATFLADRLRATTAQVGHSSGGAGEPGAEVPDELDLDLMDSVSLAAVRFDKLQKRLRERSALSSAQRQSAAGD
jgi:CRP/FNR family transcriptional regulator, cyclic AMP receptor protein